ncbi:hypothetical protein KM043_003187 [Ampulex compressa]|nr:hypothetical protein KM043_003187 [Ampulex compressa]
MGKLGPRLGSRKKAKRWAKGQSSNSNPETTKHREQANWMFFKDFGGTPGITKEDLQKHDAIQGIQPQFESMGIEEDQPESTIDGTVRTCDTFASNYSNCSNVSFSKFLQHFQSTSLLHKEMLAVLSAVTEVIKQNGGVESSTEYFAALMSTLEAIESDASVAATLSLLGIGLKTVPNSVLNVQFGAASKVFFQILSKHAESEEFLILRHCIHCLCLLLRAQEAAAWLSSSTLQVLDAILSFTTHSKPRVRKAAQHGVCAILKGSHIMRGENPPAYHPAAPQVAKHCVAQLQAAGKPGSTTSILHTLILLKDIMHQLPKSYVKTICEGLLKIMGFKKVLETSCCLQTLHGLFVSRPSETTLPAQRNAQIITALYNYQPPPTDSQPTLAWLAVMQEAHCNLAQKSVDICAAILPRMIGKCMELWLSDRPEVISGASHTMKILLQDCLGLLCSNEELMETKYSTTLDQIILLIHKALGYQYLEAWYHVLHLIALLFQITSKSKNPRLLDVLKTLAELRDSYNFAYNSDAEYAIGAAIKSMGPELVLRTIPIKEEENRLNLKRSWLIPLLKDCITTGSIFFFMDSLLPIATMCKERIAVGGAAGKTFEFLVMQIWAVLPSICNDALDVKSSFKTIAKILGTIIAEQKELRSSVMSALRKLVLRAVEKDDKGDIAELARFSRNYLPLLLNLYVTKPNGTDEEGQRLAAFDTMKIYLTITNQNLANELFDRAFDRLVNLDTDDFIMESACDILRVLMGYTDLARLKTLYDVCVPYLKDNSKGKKQKKAYRFLEDLCASDKEVCKEFVSQFRRDIQKLLVSSATSVIKTSRRPRLKCLTHLVNCHPQLEKTKFLEAVVPEAVLCVKDTNAGCRASAYQLLNTIAEKFMSNPEHLKDYVNMLIVGMGSEQKYCSSSLLALASVTYHYNGSLGMETIKETLGHACSLALSPTREVVESALSFIKVYVTTMPSPIVASTLPKLIETLSGMTEDCQRHFRQKVRDVFTKLVRKYGVGTISGMIPATDVTLRKRLKNIHKVEEQKKRNRELRRAKESEKEKDEEFSAKRRPKSIEEILADSEEEYDSDADEEPRKNKKRTSRKEAWIQENEESIIDLVDPAAARNISTTQPVALNTQSTGKKQKDRGFKTAPDGRIIITDNERDEDTKTKKKKGLQLHSDSEDDYEEEADDQSVAAPSTTLRKRKHSETSDTASTKSKSTSKYQAGGSGIHRPLKTSKTDYVVPGSEYSAPKARGDVKKKNKPDPYAYIPLSRAALNKRKKKKNAGKFQGIVAGAKKGAQAGIKKRKN